MIWALADIFSVGFVLFQCLLLLGQSLGGASNSRRKNYQAGRTRAFGLCHAWVFTR